MQIDINYRPAHAMARVILEPGEQMRAEAGALVGMSTNIDMQTGVPSGVMGGLKRWVAGESFFQNTFSARQQAGELLLAHALCGDIQVLQAAPSGHCIQSSSYIASTTEVRVETKIGGLKTFFGGRRSVRAEKPRGTRTEGYWLVLSAVSKLWSAAAN